MPLLTIFLLAVAFGLARRLYITLFLPSGWDPTIPAVPLWVSWLPLVRSALGLTPLGQDKVFARFIEPRLRQKGVVALFFGGRWNLLFAHPQGIRHIFKGNGSDDNVVAKSGNHLKIPDAVLSQLTGSNIISEHGELYLAYRKVLGPPLRASVDYAALNEYSARLVEVISSQIDGNPTSVNPILQRFAMDCVCRSIFGVDLKFLSEPPPALHFIQSKVKLHIFQPFALAFPQFDAPRWSWLFPGRVEARRAVEAMEEEAEKQLVADEADKARSSITRAMREALDEGKWTWRNLIDNTKILFIAGHENTQNALNSLLFVLARDESLQERLGREVKAVFARGPPLQVSREDLQQLPLLRACLQETLRLFPPIPQLLNRKVTRDTVLQLRDGDITHPIHISAGTYVGWTAFGLHRSERSTLWAPDPLAFRPQRWGSTVAEIEANARRAESQGQYIPFAAGVRACGGQKLALAELQVAMVHLLLRFKMRLPPGPLPAMTPGGLLMPRGLGVIFTPLPKARAAVE